MKVLFMPKQIPHEKVIGGPIIIYNRIKYLSRHHQVSLLSFLRDEEEKKYLHTVTKFCQSAEFPPLPGGKPFIKGLGQFFFSPRPPYLLTTYTEEMQDKMVEMTNEYGYDVIIAEYTVMGQYLYRNENLRGVKKVISCHEIYFPARLAAFKKEWYKKEGLEALIHLKGLKRYELDMYRSADKVLTLTHEDKDKLLSFDPELNISVVPHGVDVEYFTPQEREEDPAIMFLGNFPHLPNRDAALYFVREILPLVRKEFPDVKLCLVGRGPQKDIVALGKDPNIIVTGTVPDVRLYFKKTSLFICPVRLGGGFRGKILEAMACGRPVVSTSLGAFGAGAVDGENILIADNADEFASKVIEALKDESLWKRISTNGRKLVEERFSWQKGVEILEKVLKELVPGQ